MLGIRRFAFQTIADSSYWDFSVANGDEEIFKGAVVQLMSNGCEFTVFKGFIHNSPGKFSLKKLFTLLFVNIPIMLFEPVANHGFCRLCLDKGQPVKARRAFFIRHDFDKIAISEFMAQRNNFTVNKGPGAGMPNLCMNSIGEVDC